MNTSIFIPHPFFRNGHTQTFAASWWPHPKNWPSHVAKRQKISIENNTIIIDSHIQTENAKGKKDILLIHGFEGSSESKYMLRMAQKSLLRGYNVHRMNLRSCGDSIYTCSLPYHAGLWQDIAIVLPSILVGKEMFVVGHSLGGNLILKMAGDLGTTMPNCIKAIASVSAPLDLKMTVQFLAEQKFYHKLFIGYIMKNYSRKKKLNPGVYPELSSYPTSLEEFDNKVICPIYNFKDPDDYYLKTSSGYVLKNISIPTMMVFAQDDPIIPYSSYIAYQKEIQSNSNIQFVDSANGGHVAFISNSKIAKELDRFWADEQIFSFFDPDESGKTR